MAGGLASGAASGFAMGGPIGAGIGAGASVLGSLFSALSGSKQREAERKQQEAQLKQQQGQFNATTALNATQMDPMAQQRSRAKMALLASLMSTPGQTDPHKMDFSQVNPFLSASSRQAADTDFQNQAHASSPSYQLPDLSQVGYGSPASADGNSPMDPRRQALIEMLMAQRQNRA